MSSIVSSAGLGLFGWGELSFGGGRVGQGGDRSYVNAANGNLVIQSQDEYLMARGVDVSLLRTYNSQGLLDDDNGDNWLLSAHRSLTNLPVGSATTPMRRLTGDGYSAEFVYNGTHWVSTDGEGAHDTLKKSGSNWVYEEGSSGYRETYDSAGRLINAKDPDGNTLTYGYTGNLLTSVTDESGQVTYLDYTGTQLTQIRVESDGTTRVRVRYAYDVEGRLSEVRVDLANPDDAVADVETYVTTYSYDGSSRRLSRIQQSDGTDVSFQYTLLGGSYRLTQQTTVVGGGQADRVVSYSYDLVNRHTDVTDALGGVVRYSYDAQGRLIEVLGPEEGGQRSSTTYAYGTDDNLTQVTTLSAVGVYQTVSHDYDGNGNRIKTWDSLGNTVVRDYDPVTNLLLKETRFSVPDPDGAGPLTAGGAQETRYVYDVERHVRFVISAEGRVTEYRYSGPGNLAAMIRYTGALYTGTTQLLTDLTSWLTGVDKTQGERIDYTYDFRGQLTRERRYATLNADGAGVSSGRSSTHYVYDARGRLLQTIAPLGTAPTVLGQAVAAGQAQVTTYAYDGLGRVLSVIDGTGRETVTQYDSLNQRVSVTTAQLVVTHSHYNAAGELIAIEQRDGSNTLLGETHYHYDAAGRVRMVEDPVGGLRHSVYDAQNRLVGQIDGEGNLTETVYDLAGRVVRTVRYATRVSAALVDGSGDPLLVTLSEIRPASHEDDRIEHAIYDAANRLRFTVADDRQGVTLKRNLVEIRYDGAGREVERIAYAKRLADNVVLTEAGLLAHLADPGSLDAVYDRHSRFFYSDDGLLVGSLNAQGYLSENIYDAAGRLIQAVQYATVTDALQRATGSLGDLRPLVSVHDAWQYQVYDAKGERRALVTAVGADKTQGYLQTWTYDLNGNVTQQRRFSGQVTWSASATYATLVSDALAATPTGHIREQRVSWTYDSLGRVTRESQSTIDAVGTSRVMARTDYAYDVQSGLLTSKTTAAESTSEARTTTYLHDALGRVTSSLQGRGSAALATAGNDEQLQAQAWLRHASRNVYDAAGRLLKTTDPNGNATVYYYDRDGRVRYTVRSGAVDGGVLKGEVTEVVYNAFGQVRETIQYATRLSMGTVDGSGNKVVTLVGGTLAGALPGLITDIDNDRRVAQDYTQRGQVRTARDALGFETDSVYNAFGDLVEQETDIGSGVLRRTDTYVHDRLSRITGTTQDVGGLAVQTHYVYDAFGRVVETTDARGSVWKTSYDRLGRVVTTTDALNQGTVTSYDAHDRVLTQTDRLGHTTTYDYSVTAGRHIVTITTPEGVVTKRTRNRHGDEISVSLINGAITETTTYTYNRDGQLLTQTVNMGGASGDNLVTTHEYGDSGLLMSMVDARGIRTAYEYDPANRVLTRTVDPKSYTKPDGTVINKSSGLDLKTRYAYGAHGDVIRITDAEGVVTETIFDRNGRTAAVIVDAQQRPGKPSPLMIATTYAYDAQGNALMVREGVQATGSSGNWNTAGAALRTTTYEYDALGRLVREIADPGAGKLNITTQYVYDGNGNLSRKIDPRGSVWRYEYDAHNRLRYAIDPEYGVSETLYDKEGRVISEIRHVEAWPLDYDLLADTQLFLLDPQSERIRRDPETGEIILINRVEGSSVTETVSELQLHDTTPYTQVNIYAEVSLQEFSSGKFQIGTEGLYQYAVIFEDGLIKVSRGISGYQYIQNVGLIDFSSDYVIEIISTELKADLFVYKKGTARGPALSFGTRGDEVGVWLSVTSGPGSENEEVRIRKLSITSPALQITGKDRATSYVYDADGRMIYTVAPGNAQVVDDVLTLVNGTAGALTKFEYDSAGRVLRKTAYLSKFSSGRALTKDSLDALIAGQYFPSNADQVTQYSYDLAGRLLSVVDAEGHAELYVYDKNGNRTKLVNKLGNTWNYEYDAVNRLIEERAPKEKMHTELDPWTELGAQAEVWKTTTLAYDAVGNLTFRKEGHKTEDHHRDNTFVLGRETRYLYDAVGRQVRTLHPEVGVYSSSLNETNDYLPGTSNSYTSRREAARHLFNQTWHDASGLAVANLAGASHASGSFGVFTYKVYDAAGRLEYEVDAERYVVNYVYDTAGNVTVLRRYASEIDQDAVDSHGHSLTDYESSLKNP